MEKCKSFKEVQGPPSTSPTFDWYHIEETSGVVGVGPILVEGGEGSWKIEDGKLR